FWPVIFAGLIALWRPTRLEIRLVAALAGALISYFSQARGFPYQLAPAICLAVVLMASKLRQQSLIARAPAAFLLAIIAALVMLIGPYRSGYPLDFPPGTKVLVLSDRVSAAYPSVLEKHLHSVSPYPAVWPPPGAWQVLHDPAASQAKKTEATRILDGSRRELLRRIESERPDYILADRLVSERFGPAPFDWYGWLSGGAPLENYHHSAQNRFFDTYSIVR
ncbi:MAG TPA: hypothetical protein VFN88_00775, partial [Caulobacteraceae bacterium]|nr:hypothetical protein [Caulobacteraceae bacterium]